MSCIKTLTRAESKGKHFSTLTTIPQSPVSINTLFCCSRLPSTVDRNKREKQTDTESANRQLTLQERSTGKQIVPLFGVYCTKFAHPYSFFSCKSLPSTVILNASQIHQNDGYVSQQACLGGQQKDRLQHCSREYGEPYFLLQEIWLLNLPQGILQVAEHELLHHVVVCGPHLLQTCMYKDKGRGWGGVSVAETLHYFRSPPYA